MNLDIEMGNGSTGEEQGSAGQVVKLLHPTGFRTRETFVQRDRVLMVPSLR